MRFGLLLSLICLPFRAFSATPPLAEIKLINQMDQVSDAVVVKTLAHYKWQPVQTSEYPGFKDTPEKIQKLLQKLVLPKDGTEPIYVVIADDFNINACFIRLRDTKARVVVVNAGLLSFVDSDDELAYVLGHELEHGTSEIEAAEALKAPKLYTERINHSLMLKSVENEVDVKSVLNRVHDNKMNPLKAREFLIKLREAVGDEINPTHTMLGTRINTLDAATTALTRKAGESLNGDTRSSIINEKLKANFTSARAKAVQTDKIEKFLATRQEGLEEYFKDILTSEKTDRDIYMSRQNLPEWVSKRGRDFSQLLSNAFSPEEKHLLKKRMQASVLVQMREIRDEAIAGLGKPLTARQTYALSSAQSLHLLAPTSDSYIAKLEELGKTESEQKFLKQRAGKGMSETERAIDASRMEYLKQRNSKLVAELKVLRSGYDPDPQVDRIFAKAVQFNKSKRGRQQFPDFNERMSRNSFIRELQPFEKYVGPARIQHENEIMGLLQQRAKELGENYVTKAYFAEKYMVPYRFEMSIPNVSPDLTAKFSNRFRSAYIDSWSKAYAAADAPLQARMVSHANFFLERYRFPEAEVQDILKDRSHPYNTAMRKYLDTVIEHSKSHDAISRAVADFLPREGPRTTDGFAVKGTLDSDMREMRAHWFEDLGRHLFDQKRGDAYFKRRMELLGTDLKLQATKNELFSKEILNREFKTYEHYISVLKPQQFENSLEGVFDQFGKILSVQSHGSISESLGREIAKSRLDELFAEKLKIYFKPKVTGLEIINQLQPALKDPKNRALLTEAFQFDGLLKNLNDPQKKKVFEFIENYPDLVSSATHYDVTTPDEAKEYFKNRLQFSDWAVERGPATRKIASDHMITRELKSIHLSGGGANFEYEEFTRLTKWINRKAVHYEYARLLNNPSPNRYREFYARLSGSNLAEIKRTGNPVLSRTNELISTGEALAVRVKSIPERIRFIEGFHEFNKIRTIPPGKKDYQIDLYKTIRRAELEESMKPLGLTSELALKNPKLSFEEKSQILDLNLKVAGSSPETDQLFQSVLAETKLRKLPVEKYLDPALIPKLHYDAAKQEVAKWQLDEKFQLAASRENAKKLNYPLNHTRTEIHDIKKTIEIQFPESSLIRDSIVDYTEGKMIATEAETDILNDIRINKENWASSAELAYLDVPTKVSQFMTTQHERKEMIDYLIDPTNKQEYPAFYERLRLNNKIDPTAEKAFTEMRARFRQANVYSRNFVLMPLLDEKTGALSEKAVRDELTNTILGAQRKEPVYKSLFEAYLESVPESQLKAIYGHVLSGFVDTTPGVTKSAGATIRSVLESMGPFGIKAGQFIRTSGIASPEIAKELDSFLDNALAPTQKKIINDVKLAFGDNLKEILSIGELKGSGSINYAVRVIAKNPVSGKSEEVLVSIQRDAVEGMVKNENDIWQKAISKMENGDNPENRKIAALMEEARLNAYDTLKAGGIELDQGVQRANFSKAQEIYGRDALQTRSEYSIEAVRPLEEFQTLVADDIQHKYSFYEHIDAVSWKDVADPALKAKLAADVVDAELSALAKGTFDRDGHRGNWLVDTKNERLVRIDYAQLETYPDDEVKAFLETLKITANPWITTFDAKKLAKNLETVFSISNAPHDISESMIKKIILSKNFVRGNPQATLFYIRQELEADLIKLGHANASVRFAAASRSGLMSFGKLMDYETDMGHTAFKRLLAEKLGFEWKDVVESQIKRPIATIKNTIERVFPQCAEGGISGFLKAVIPAKP